MEDNFFTTSLKILELEHKKDQFETLRVRFFSTLEDGGLGLLPFSALRKPLLSSTEMDAKDLIMYTGFPSPRNRNTKQQSYQIHVEENFQDAERNNQESRSQHNRTLFLAYLMALWVKSAK